MKTKKLIGGAKLRELGSTRHTDDVDYLIFDKNDSRTFIHNLLDGDVINCANNSFFKAIWEYNKESEDICLQSLFDLCCYAFEQHVRNFNENKEVAKIHDIVFLSRKIGKENLSFNLLKKHLLPSTIEEIKKYIK